MEFLKLKPDTHPRLTRSDAERSESRYWRDFKNPVFVKSYAPISHITFSIKSPHRFCISSGTKIQIYSPKTLRVVKTISRFQLPVRFSDIKSDGKLVISSDDSGLVQVFDLNSRAILRSFQDHKQPVHVARFSPSSSSILTCSDDSTVRLFDLATSKTLRTFIGHSDYVRAGSFMAPNLVLSGGYDGKLNLWDDRINENNGLVWTLDHEEPIENILIHPSGTLGVSAGGPVARVWDLLGGSGNKQNLVSLSNHQKTITSLSWAIGPCDGDDDLRNPTRRLLSGGLDGLVKVYDLSTGSYKVRHTIRYSSPILSMGVSPDDGTLVVGCTDGSLSIRKRQQKKVEAQRLKAAKDTQPSIGMSLSGAVGSETVWDQQDTHLMEEMARAGLDSSNEENPREALEGADPGQHVVQTTVPVPETTVTKRKRKQKLQVWDRMLKSFRYGDALDSVLTPATPPNITFALCRELIHRDGLHQALSGRDEVSLAPILRFLTRYITDPRWFNIGSDVMKCIMELYEPVLGKSDVIDSLFNKLWHRVTDEVKLHSKLFEINGQIEMILANF
ncbi:WD40-repeat-containing domain protein [Melampsora americana]|nr:WD40-repeat-containing domain protein [Melampsora americana]